MPALGGKLTLALLSVARTRAPTCASGPSALRRSPVTNDDVRGDDDVEVALGFVGVLNREERPQQRDIAEQRDLALVGDSALFSQAADDERLDNKFEALTCAVTGMPPIRIP